MQVFQEFLQDASDSYAKGRWLRRALKLHARTQDVEVEKHLQSAVNHCFAVLQSLLQETTVSLSTRYIASIALFLHLRTFDTSKLSLFWHAARLQEESARGLIKRYVTVDKLGIEAYSPLCQFPRVCGEHVRVPGKLLEEKSQKWARLRRRQNWSD